MKSFRFHSVSNLKNLALVSVCLFKKNSYNYLKRVLKYSFTLQLRIYLCKGTFKEELIPILYRFFGLVEEKVMLFNSLYESDPDTKAKRTFQEKKVESQ